MKLLEKQLRLSNYPVFKTTNVASRVNNVPILRLQIQFSRHIGHMRRDGNGSRLPDCVKFPSSLDHGADFDRGRQN